MELEQHFLVKDINEQWRRGHEHHLSGAWDHAARLEVLDGDGIAGEVVLYSALVTAGMPFLCLVGAAPNAIAYESGQFTSAEFFKVGIPASAVLMIVVAIFVYLIWPLMGMPVQLGV